MKFDVILGNPPYNGKTNVHFKMMPMLSKVVKDDGVVALIIPKNMFVQNLPRAEEYCNWLYSMEYKSFNDVDPQHFSSVADILVWFVAINNGKASAPDLSAKLPDFKFNAKRVVGIDFGHTSKVRDDTYIIPLICGVAVTGEVNRHRFATKKSLSKLDQYRGKPVLHINTHGAMVEFPKVAYLDESGSEYWFRQGVGSFVFDNIDEARKAEAWFNGPQFKEYVQEWKKGGWFFKNNIELLFNDC